MAGTTLSEVIHAMVDSIDPDSIQNKANELMPIPDDQSHTDVQLTQIMHQLMEKATVSLRNPKAREWISDTKRLVDQTIDVTSQDFLLGAVVSKEVKNVAKLLPTRSRIGLTRIKMRLSPCRCSSASSA